MRIKTIISGSAALVLSIYALIMWNMTHGLNAYMVSYDMGKWLVWVYIPVAVLALVGWILFAVWIPKDAVKLYGTVKAKAAEAKERSEQLRAQQAQWQAQQAAQWQQPVVQPGQQSSQPMQPEQQAEQCVQQPVQQAGKTAAKFCTSCGAPLLPGQKFCTSCGAAVNQ